MPTLPPQLGEMMKEVRRARVRISSGASRALQRHTCPGRGAAQAKRGDAPQTRDLHVRRRIRRSRICAAALRAAARAGHDEESATVADEPAADWRQLETFAFGDGPALADELIELVLQGRKRASCWPVSAGSPTHVGKRMVALDGAGRPRAVLETVELTERRFCDVDAAFAFDEGEGDRSLAYWRDAHRTYFTRNGGFAPDMLLCCERFRLVARIDASAS
jgi:uncharacterized protein YhfF